jgi:hypothetical protein
MVEAADAALYDAKHARTQTAITARFARTGFGRSKRRTISAEGL